MLAARAKEYRNLFRERTELRVQAYSFQAIRLADGKLTENTINRSSGISTRVYKNGVYGFTSTADYSVEAVKDALQKAEKNAAMLSERVKEKSGPLPTIAHGEYETSFIVRNIEQSEMLALAREVDEYLLKNCPGLSSRVVRTRLESTEKDLVVADGICAHTVYVRSHIHVFMYAKGKDGATVSLDDSFGGRGYPDSVFEDKGPLFAWINKMYQNVMAKRESVYSESGYKDIILAPDLAGMLAHEAVGHTVEADMVRAGSVAGFNMEKEVASELITLVDLATQGFGQEMPFPVYVDDEGVKGEDAIIIENGILKNYLHNRESALAMGMKPLGNARAYDYFDEPLIRMRNTFFMPGSSSLDDMITSVDDGYFLAYPANGQADMTGEFMFGAAMGYEIKKGKIARPVREVTLAGFAFDLLKTVDMVSNDLVIRSGGMCGKKQLIGVSMGGPAIKCKANISGR